jgi:hypothetical protein
LVIRSFKKTLSIFLLPVCIGLFVSPSNSQLPPETWSQFRGGHHLMGVSVSNVPKDLRVLWTYEAGESIESSAAIAGVYGSQSGQPRRSVSDGRCLKYKARANRRVVSPWPGNCLCRRSHGCFIWPTSATAKDLTFKTGGRSNRTGSR